MCVRLCLTCVYVGWWCVSRLQWIQVKDFISPDVRNELQDWRRRRGGGGGRCLLTLTSVSDGRDRRRAPPAGDDDTRQKYREVTSPSGSTELLTGRVFIYTIKMCSWVFTANCQRFHKLQLTTNSYCKVFIA